MKYHGLLSLYTSLRYVDPLSVQLNIRIFKWNIISFFYTFFSCQMINIYFHNVTVGYHVDHDEEREEGSSSFQENAISTI